MGELKWERQDEKKFNQRKKGEVQRRNRLEKQELRHKVKVFRRRLRKAYSLTGS